MFSLQNVLQLFLLCSIAQTLFSSYCILVNGYIVSQLHLSCLIRSWFSFCGCNKQTLVESKSTRAGREREKEVSVGGGYICAFFRTLRNGIVGLTRPKGIFCKLAVCIYIAECSFSHIFTKMACYQTRCLTNQGGLIRY